MVCLPARAACRGWLPLGKPTCAAGWRRGIGAAQFTAFLVKAKLNNGPNKSFHFQLCVQSQPRTTCSRNPILLYFWEKRPLHLSRLPVPEADAAGWVLAMAHRFWGFPSHKHRGQELPVLPGERAASPCGLPLSPRGPGVLKCLRGWCREQHTAALCWWNPWICSYPAQYLMLFQWEKPPA